MFRVVQNLFASMSLERKCLLFFGSALLVLMCGAFCVVLILAKNLVLDTTRQRARDFGASELYRLHVNAAWSRDAPPGATDLKRQVLAELRDELLTKSIQFEILALDDAQKFENMPTDRVPESPVEQRILEDLEPRFRDELARRYAEDRPDIEKPLDLGENESMSRFDPFNEPVFVERGPIPAEEDGIPAEDDAEAGEQAAGEETGTNVGLLGGEAGEDRGNDRYVHYTPVFPQLDCVSCHAPIGASVSMSPDLDPRQRAAQAPFRVMKVSMPYSDALEQETWIQAILIAMAMLIVAVTLFVLHAIVRYLILEPLYHLRDVSDAITRGDTNQRATIDTEDEFRELADAFNRMLRHLTETQEQIQEVNHELDARVDQLAQLNLQLYEANRLKSDFLANMSHELRTPLNSIIGFSEVLQGIDALSDKQRRYASNIQKSGRLLLEMINDILDLAKVEAGKMEVRRSEFDLGRLVSAQCDMIHSLSEDKNIALTVDVPDDLPPVYQDPNKLGQILNNLLSNAIKFTPEGGTITVRVGPFQDGRFRLSVSDTGVGIADEDKHVIFQKFRQSKQVLDGEGLTRQFAGTGLGLSIVKELAKLLGGEIAFESELGRGSTFWITLPIKLTDNELLVAAAGPAVSNSAADDPTASRLQPT